MSDFNSQFEARKQDHIRIALSEAVQTRAASGLDEICLLHEAIPDLDFSEVDLSSTFFGRRSPVPFYVSSMTAGHPEAPKINSILVRAASRRGWPMGVGSQRRELTDPAAAKEWRDLRRECPAAILLGNLGMAELIRARLEDIQRLVDHLEADAFFVHCNPLQEGLQAEGNPNYKGSYSALERVARALSIPVVVKETGCGFSRQTMERLKTSGVAAVDVAGLGGTHWGRVEGYRNPAGHLLHESAKNFADWGIPTVQSILWAKEVGGDFDVWASGGIRHGLDAAKVLSLGADRVGIAQPLLAAALQGEEQLDHLMSRFEFELRLALFCTGQNHYRNWKQQKVWRWKSIETS
ncbi:MAG: type 2 isopentenyl-diphosphate Delta-isomerase [Bdellovibrio sp.]|nr:MAG: type 2 isopentenyl-diphosphate Delta-isomerase [Bdellovibrio sp.]